MWQGHSIYILYVKLSPLYQYIFKKRKKQLLRQQNESQVLDVKFLVHQQISYKAHFAEEVHNCMSIV